ncbi:MAG: hypothetical protein IJR94_04690 [Synergistaceae bacterium]|nr:hypothetical protein [Synergistaceae bacterium]
MLDIFYSHAFKNFFNNNIKEGNNTRLLAIINQKEKDAEILNFETGSNRMAHIN